METVCNIWDKPCLGRGNVGTQESCTSSFVGPRAPGLLVGCSVWMASPDVDWWWWCRLASIAIEWWSWLRVATNEREEERDVFGVHLIPFSLIQISKAFDSTS